MTIVDNSDLVPVLVPRKLVMDVYRLISEKTSPVPPKAQHNPAPITGDEVIAGWDARLLKRMYDESDKNMRAILDRLIENAGKTVKASDLINVLAHSRDDKMATSMTLGGTLGAFGRRVGNRYKRDHWPFEGTWSTEEHQVHYLMSEKVASVLRDS